MSQFDLKFGEYRDNNPTANQGNEVNPDYYPASGHVRNLAFVWPDGRMQFFNYSYLISCKLNNEDGSIFIEFSTHNVELKGQKLILLFEELMIQSKKVIRCIDTRYQAVADNSRPIIQSILVTTKGY